MCAYKKNYFVVLLAIHVGLQKKKKIGNAEHLIGKPTRQFMNGEQRK